MRSTLIAAFGCILFISGCGSYTSGTGSGAVAELAPSTETVFEEAILQATGFQSFEEVPVASVPGEVAEVMPSGEIDWSGNTVRAAGVGVVDPDNPNRAQARLMAERAAVVVAQRNLLETVQGVRVDSETRVENFMTDYDVIYTRVEGVVRNARQTGPARYDSIAGTVEVELEMEIHSPAGLSGALREALAADPGLTSVSMSDQTRDFLSQYSALVFDGSRAGLQPSMYPRIYDSGGNLLIDTSEYAGYIGSAGTTAIQFISDLDRLLSGSEFAGSPLVVQVSQAAGMFGSDIVLGVEDSSALGWLRSGLPFLMGAGRFLLNIL